MFNKDDKRRIYQLIHMFLSKKITATTFCDEFYYAYDLELNYSTLSELEEAAFSDLSKVADRFSEFEEDHKTSPGVFYTEEDLIKATNQADERLKEEKTKLSFIEEKNEYIY